MSHPDRAGLAEELRTRLGGRASITYDPDPAGRRSPWRTYRECLDSTPACSHRLIVQDDIDPCPHFLTAVRSACRARPDDVLVFYVGGNAPQICSAMYRASAAGAQWALVQGQFIPTLAVVWPVGLVCPVVCWADEQVHWPESFVADDEIIRHALDALHVFAFASVPSLVDHRNELPSLMQTRHLDDPGRRAACLIGEECDARRIDWSP